MFVRCKCYLSVRTTFCCSYTCQSVLSVFVACKRCGVNFHTFPRTTVKTFADLMRPKCLNLRELLLKLSFNLRNRCFQIAQTDVMYIGAYQILLQLYVSVHDPYLCVDSCSLHLGPVLRFLQKCCYH